MLSREELLRYSRHLIVPEIGLTGQAALKHARIALVGAGGLGSPAALYLAAAGVGTLGIIDSDIVDLTNLQRQVVHGVADLGRPKTVSAAESVGRINPNVAVLTFGLSLSSANALDVLAGFDVVVDGSDNFPTRYLVNDACVLLGTPNVHGSIYRFDGQVTVFGQSGGPCYRCLFPDPPPPGTVPSCAEGGVLGVLPGVIGLIQATEAIKIVLGQGTSLAGRLLLYDALGMTFREFAIHRNVDCPVCGDSPSVTELVDYEVFCGLGPAREETVGLGEVAPAELFAALNGDGDVVVVDVREPHEHAINRIPGSMLIPLAELSSRLAELSGADSVVVYCLSGSRSAQACAMLRQAGFDGVRNLRGGIRAWIAEVEPSLPLY